MNQQQLAVWVAANPQTAAMLLGMAQVTQKGLSATTPLAISPHGPGGLLSTPGLEPGIMNAMVMPLSGLEARLPVRLSNTMNPIYGILTGQTASTGSEPTAACATPTQVGNLKLCQQTYSFGRITKQSNVIRIDNAGQVINRSDFLDHRLIGDPFANLPMPQQVSTADVLKNVAKKALFELMVGLHRDYKKKIYTANPANTTGSEGYIEWRGLDMLINTGYRDAITGAVCPAADSRVVSFGNALVTADTAVTVNLITELYADRKRLADRLGLDVKLALAMSYGLFRALTAIWPCAYLTYRCAPVNGNAGNQVTYNGEEAIRLRDDMRKRSYLLIDGEEVEVIIDDAIAETIPSNGVFQGDIYFVPLTVNGEAATFIDYFNFNGPEGASSIIQALGATTEYRISPDGRFLFHYLPAQYWCKQVAVVAWKRPILRAPFLAARLTNMRYNLTFHERGWDPSDPYYFVNGGTQNLNGYTPSYLYPPTTGG